MDSQVRVASLDRFQDFRNAYAKFGDVAQQALLTVDLEIRRMLDWLEKDQAAYWKGEIRRREEKLNEAKAALHRKRITATFGNVATDADEIVAVRRAQAKLEAAEAKMKAVKQWYQAVEQEVTEYRCPSRQFGNILEADVPQALAALERMMTSLEGYLNVAAPSSGSGLATSGVGNGATSAEQAAIAAIFSPPPPSAAQTEGSADASDKDAATAETEGAA